MVAASGAVLAGGESRRMGHDKRAILINGQPLLRRVLLVLAQVASDVMVVTRPDLPLDPAWLQDLAVRTVYDRQRASGPLAGIEAALIGARHDLVIVVAADMPTLRAPLLGLLVESASADPRADAVMIQSLRGAEPLLAVYHRRVRGRIASLLSTGERRVSALAAMAETRLLPRSAWHHADPTGASLCNLNRPSDLATFGIEAGGVPYAPLWPPRRRGRP